ncbi:SEC14 cytosolic factor [Verticillium dahliae VdLs.17]|uniref:SEC14 cytosolic factor n=1 Tax=Verticillium dahliae (strain VdLs.17 / ATCC MYA-4575 / FGSC 10137) TaxID=498257 RepID=G2WSS8_VERDV|nr:SEC14 cytosolic factor [Verticillium dahliae VdLs.17]EGY17177.1 SEC14 cytosolic factor [Verticillium dahliae VdLs.17]
MAAQTQVAPELVAPELDPKYDNFDYPTKAAKAQDGHPGHCTEAQKAQIHQLRMMLESEGVTQRLDTLTLLRFLRARKFDVNASKAMFVEFDKWRKEVHLDALVPTWEYKEREQMLKFYPQYYHKTDVMRTITTDERMLDNLAVEYEKCADPRFPACSVVQGTLVETCCTIMDLKGVSIGNASQVYGYVKQASVISQNYYPERLGKLYIINAPWTFSVVWSVVKGWLDPVTVNKIDILGGGYAKELLKQIPAENLPVEFGGKCKCAEGCQNSNAGPWQEPQWKNRAWWDTPEAKQQALAALKGTSKDPHVIVNEGSEIVTAPTGAAGAAPAGTADAGAPAGTADVGAPAKATA